MYKETSALQKILSLRSRLWVIQGGTSAGKTIAIMIYLIAYAQNQTVSINVVAESIPHLKRGAMRDFLNIMKAQGYFNEASWNKTDRTYTFKNGSYIEFFSADDADKLRGGRRDVLFINECNNVTFNAFEQLEVRTKVRVILDFNPVSEFWANTEVMPHTEHDFLKLTYKDNEALDPAIIKSIESKRHNKNWWRIYGMGEMGIKEGQVYTEWSLIDDIPEEAWLVRRGLDFGYTNDPTALVDVYKLDNGLIFDELTYRTGMTNPDIANKIKDQLTEVLTVADSAEPKSIDEIASYGIEIVGAIKGQGSVNYGIQLLQDQKIYVTKNSTNTIKEQRNYLWKLDRDGKPLNTPEHAYSHAMDAIRYAVTDLLGNPEPSVIGFYKTEYNTNDE